MGRPKKKGRRTASGRLSRATDAMAERNPPNDRVLKRRKLFAWVRPPVDKNGKPIDGHNGEVDQQVRDAIGQFQVLGLLDGTRFDSEELLDAGRKWASHYIKVMRGEKLTAKAQSYERRDRGRTPTHEVTAADEIFDAADLSLDHFERQVLTDLIVHPEIGCWPEGEEFAPWSRALIGEALLERGLLPETTVFPTDYDRHLLEVAKGALVGMVDAVRQMRRAA